MLIQTTISVVQVSLDWEQNSLMDIVKSFTLFSICFKEKN